MSFRTTLTRIASFFSRNSSIALDIVAEVTPVLLANPEWTDDERREYIVDTVADTIGRSNPRYAAVVSIAVKLAVSAVRSQLNRKGRD